MFDWFAMACGFLAGVIVYTLLIYICVRKIKKKGYSIKLNEKNNKVKGEKK